MTGGERALPLVWLLVAVACSIDDRLLTVTDAATPPPRGVALLPDGQGFVDGANAVGIMGYFYVTSDSIEPDGCLSVGFTAEQCSEILTPPHDGYTFAVSDPNRICTSGVAAKVILNPSTMLQDFEHIWGAEIGLDFNNPKRTNANQGPPYDARAHAVTGFSFVIDSPPSALRVAFPTADNPRTASYWGGGMTIVSPVQPGLNVIRWKDVGGPIYLTDPPAFDETQLRGMQLVVVSNGSQPVAYDFCISNLTALTE